jgi:Xaa-Pro aminopeptidase
MGDADSTGTVDGSASHDPDRPAALLEFMTTGWAVRDEPLPAEHPSAPFRARRRAALAERFPGERLVVPTGGYKTRANDTEYRFRPATEFAHLVGSHEPDAVLVVEPDGSAVLYQAPVMDRSTPAFFTDRVYGELWVGPRPSLEATSALLGIATRPLEELTKLSGAARVVRGYDARVEGLFETDEAADAELTAFLSELRLVKDEHEVAQLQDAVDATDRRLRGRRALAAAGPRDERALAGGRLRPAGPGRRQRRRLRQHLRRRRARLHAALDRQRRPGPRRRAGAAGHGRGDAELYTADVTRTLPVSGTFSPRQRQVYELVHRAQEAGIAACRRGLRSSSPHRAAMQVLAHGLVELGVLEDAEAGAGRGRPPLPPLHPARRQPHARAWTCTTARTPARSCTGTARCSRLRADRRAGAVLPAGRPHRARGPARHRRADRGRRADHRGRLPQPVGRAAAGRRRGRGLDAGAAAPA